MSAKVSIINYQDDLHIYIVHIYDVKFKKIKRKQMSAENPVYRVSPSDLTRQSLSPKNNYTHIENN